MKYSPEDLSQGLNLKRQAEETPTNFGILDSATERPTGENFGKSRMAGAVGERALQMINDPNEQKRVSNWMSQFGMTNEGMQFNQARMMIQNPEPQQPQEGEQA
jgi:hypothetical protein